MSPRVYVRKFDHDAARARYAAGETIADIARDACVSRTAVARVVREDVRQRMDAQHERWHRASCPDCGAPTTRRRLTDERRCTRCASIAKATTVRPNELRCVTCREWKPDDSFPKNRHEWLARRGRHGQCRSCATETRRDHRRRNREADNAYQRAYRARRRAEERDAS